MALDTCAKIYAGVNISGVLSDWLTTPEHLEARAQSCRQRAVHTGIKHAIGRADLWQRVERNVGQAAWIGAAIVQSDMAATLASTRSIPLYLWPNQGPRSAHSGASFRLTGWSYPFFELLFGRGAPVTHATAPGAFNLTATNTMLGWQTQASHFGLCGQFLERLPVFLASKASGRGWQNVAVMCMAGAIVGRALLQTVRVPTLLASVLGTLSVSLGFSVLAGLLDVTARLAVATAGHRAKERPAVWEAKAQTLIDCAEQGFLAQLLWPSRHAEPRGLMS